MLLTFVLILIESYLETQYAIKTQCCFKRTEAEAREQVELPRLNLGRRPGAQAPPVPPVRPQQRRPAQDPEAPAIMVSTIEYCMIFRFLVD